MPQSARLHTRLTALSKRLGAFCPGCAGRNFDQIYYRFDGCLRDHDGRPVSESVLEPCPVCGRDSPGGIKVIVGVDPAGERLNTGTGSFYLHAGAMTTSGLPSAESLLGNWWFWFN